MLNLIPLQAAGTQSNGMMNIVMIVLLIAIFYFLMIRPQQKKQKEIKKFREGLKKGDTVISAGGIYGKIKEIVDNYILMSITDGVTIKIDKGSVYPAANPTDAQQDIEAKKNA